MSYDATAGNPPITVEEYNGYLRRLFEQTDDEKTILRRDVTPQHWRQITKFVNAFISSRRMASMIQPKRHKARA